MQRDSEIIEHMVEPGPANHFGRGLVVALTVSALLHAVAVAGVYAWVGWSQSRDTASTPVLSIVVLGNVGGSPGNQAGEQPTRKPPVRPVLEKPHRPPITRNDDPPPLDLMKSIQDTQRYAAKIQVLLPNVSIPEFTVQIQTPTPQIQKAWQTTSNWLVDQLPKLKIPEPKAIAQQENKTSELPLMPPVELPKKMPHSSDQPKPPEIAGALPSPEKVEAESRPNPKPEPVQNQGDSAFNGNNRTGSGVIGSGGNNNGVDAPAQLDFDCTAPPYPAEADRRNLVGTVMLFIEYDATGHITKVTLHESSGIAILDSACIEHVQYKWSRVKPKVQNGRTAPGSVLVPFTFRKI